jgi:hypothetical protein
MQIVMEMQNQVAEMEIEVEVWQAMAHHPTLQTLVLAPL